MGVTTTKAVALGAALAAAAAIAACGSSADSGDGAGGAGGSGGSGATGLGGPGGGFAALPQASACARYVTCLRDAQPVAVKAATLAYGPDAACWREGEAAASRCEAACRAAASATRGCAECDSDADCAGQPGASTCLHGVCAAAGCAFDARVVDGFHAAACVCDPAACAADAAFVASLGAASSGLACGQPFDAWARCEAATLACKDGRVDLYAACDAELTALTACENAPPAPCPAPA